MEEMSALSGLKWDFPVEELSQFGQDHWNFMFPAIALLCGVYLAGYILHYLLKGLGHLIMNMGAGASSLMGAGASAPMGAGSSSPMGAGASAPMGAGASAPIGAGASSLMGAGASSLMGASAPMGVGASAPMGGGDAMPWGKGLALPSMGQATQSRDAAPMGGGDAMPPRLGSPVATESINQTAYQQAEQAYSQFEAKYGVSGAETQGQVFDRDTRLETQVPLPPPRAAFTDEAIKARNGK